ncbi:MAG: LLM class flavin-dependent oxidoreductase [Gulosibacter sp.]|uniref:LLM class flavin-dependent oxidoreductase n=1 Tax=Gulosibacter sp. TaxID=2817531 RepID=UPI003F8E4DF0
MSAKPKRRMALTTFVIPAGHHKDSWRREGSRIEEVPGLEYVVELAQMAEDAKIDAVFFGDIANANPTLRGDIKTNGYFEPISTLSAIAARTKSIGLIGTVSTSFENPYSVARQIAGIDHMSGGRAGWNLVTSFDGFQNYGFDEAPSPEARYRRATEFAQVVKALWDSWQDDAVIADRGSGSFIDPEKVHRINHVGEHFKVEGPLPGPRSPQGHPVIVQAGSSGPGLDLGSSVADAIYTAQPVKERSVEFYSKFKKMLVEKGRNPEHTKVLPGILPIIGSTLKEAQELADELGSLVNLEYGRAQVSAGLAGVDLSSLDYDDRIPAEWLSEDPALGSRYHVFRSKVVDQEMTLRDLIIDMARSAGHQWIIGTPQTIADSMVDWFESGACDGFNLNSPYNPGGMKQMCELLVPELQNRGYARTEYEGSTLREHLGLPRPAV